MSDLVETAAVVGNRRLRARAAGAARDFQSVGFTPETSTRTRTQPTRFGASRRTAST